MGFFDNIFGGGNSAELKQLTAVVQQLSDNYQKATDEITALRQEVAEVKQDRVSLKRKLNKAEEELGLSCMITLQQNELIDDMYNTMMSDEEENLKDILGAVPIESYRDYSANHRNEAHRIITGVQIAKHGSVSDAYQHEAWQLVYNRMRRITTVDLYNEYDHYYKPKHLFSGAYLDMVSKNELWFRIFKAAAKQVTIIERNEWSWQR